MEIIFGMIIKRESRHCLSILIKKEKEWLKIVCMRRIGKVTTVDGADRGHVCHKS